MLTKRIYRLGLLLLAVIVILTELRFIRRYLLNVTEPIESFGAAMLVGGSIIFLFSLWIPSMRFRYRWVVFAILIALSLCILLMAYALMVRW